MTAAKRTYSVKDGRDQVRHLLPAFRRALEQLDGYRYNAAFVGKIDGMDAASPRDEETAIYLLQTLESDTTRDERISELLAAGWQEVTAANADHWLANRPASVIVASAGNWIEIDAGRLVIGPGGDVTGVLPKGKRTHGVQVHHYVGHAPARVIVKPRQP